MQKNKTNFFYCSIIFIIGITLGYFSTQFHLFDIKYEIDVIPTTLSILTLIIGLYIATVIQSRVSDKRIEKDIIIKRLNEIRDNLKLISSLIDSSQDSGKVTSEFKSASKLLSTLEKITKYYCGDNFVEKVNSIKNHLFQYKQYSTGVSVQNNKFLYTSEARIKINNIEDKILSSVDEFMFDVNRFNK